MGMVVRFPDGTAVQATGLPRPDDDEAPDFALYLDARWRDERVEWDHVIVDWPDFGLPRDVDEAFHAMREAFARARAGEHVEVGCLGGTGRTGTVLACMAVLAGVGPADAVTWVRSNYRPGAVETPEQEQLVADFGASMAVAERAWCYYRNIVQTVYREIRHAGAPGDQSARLEVADASLAHPMASIRTSRALLKGTQLFEQIRSTMDTSAIRQPYEAVTGLSLNQVRGLFARPGWASMYGGAKWEEITSLAIQLGEAVDEGESEAADRLCDVIKRVHHNSGALVPASVSDQNPEKWPCLCD